MVVACMLEMIVMACITSFFVEKIKSNLRGIWPMAGEYIATRILTFKKCTDRNAVQASTHHSEEASQEDMAYVACTGLACMRLVAPEEAYQASWAEEERWGEKRVNTSISKITQRQRT